MRRAEPSHTTPEFVISTLDNTVYGEDTPENQEIVRRIHACVDACEGISTEELENGIVQDMRRVIAGVAPLLRERMGKPEPAEESL